MNKKILIGLVALAAVIFAITSVRCNRGGNSAAAPATSDSQVLDLTEQAPATVMAYVDASGSMRGYFDARTNGNMGASLSNSNPAKVVWLDRNKTELKKDYNTKAQSYAYAGGESRFEDMLKTIKADVLVDTTGNLTDNVALLFTDGIMSGSSQDTKKSPEYAIRERVQLMNDVTAAMGQGLGAVIIPLSCGYNGKYFNYRNQPVTLTADNRPFYIIALGKPAVLRHFMANHPGLDTSRAVAYGLKSQTINGNGQYTLAPLGVPKDGIITFSGSYPAYLTGADLQGAKVTLNGQPLPPSAQVEAIGGTVKIAFCIDPSKPGAVFLPEGQNTLVFEVPNQAAGSIEYLHSESDLDIAKDADQQSKTFNLHYLNQGIQAGAVKDAPTAFMSTITFDKPKLK